jgi:predicted phosphodiesterase
MKTSLLLLVLFSLLISCATSLKFPKEEVSYLKLCFVGDMGKGSVAQLSVAQALKHEKCHEIYFLGDIIYPNGIQSSKDPAFERLFYNYYKKLPQEDHHPKLHIILGNHDYSGLPDAWLDVAKEHSEIVFPARYYWEKKEDLCLVILDSNGANFTEQTAWIETQKKFWNNCESKIALAHHPLFTNGPNHVTASNEIKNYYESNILGKFDFLITGHEHVVENLGEIKGTRLLLSGAGGAVASGYRPGYVTLEKVSEQSTSLLVKLKTIGSDGVVDVKSFVKAN